MSADPALRIALLVSLFVYALAVIQLLLLGVMHVMAQRRKRVEQQIRAQFGPAFVEAVEGVESTLPPIPKGHAESVLMLWLFYAESTRGKASERLRALGKRLGFAQIALGLLGRHRLASTLIASATLGRLGNDKAWQALEAIASRGGTRVSLVALRSLLQIDTARGLGLLFQLLPTRTDWPASRLNALIAEQPSALAVERIEAALVEADAAVRPRLLRLLDVLRPSGTWKLVQPFLTIDQDVDTLSAAMRLVDDPRALAAVRQLASHPHWVVRSRAAMALGRIGELEDAALLRSLLGDPVWWVRYRAGQALLRLPGLDRSAAAGMLEVMEDPFARDMLRQILAETEPAR